MRTSLWIAVLVLTTTCGTAFAGVIPQAVVEQTYAEVGPAICIVSYSAEVTHPGSGETSRQSATSLGVLVSADGLVISHGHLIQDDQTPFNIRITVGQGTDEVEYAAEALRKPDDINLSFLKIQHDGPLDLPHVRFTQDAPLAHGESVLILGILGEAFEYARLSIERRVGAILEKPRLTYCLDDQIPFGAVSAPVIDGAGQVVGLVGFDLSPEEGGDIYIRSGHPLIYHADLFAKYIKNPPAKEEPDDGREDGWLGVFTQPLTEDLAKYWGIEKPGGVVVSAVMAGSPAESAGIQRGDIIVSFDGTPIRVKLDREVLVFTKLVRETGPREDIPVRILRDGEPMDLALDVGVRPKSEEDAEEYEDDVFGITVREITTDMRIMLNLGDDIQGVLVRRVKSGGTAALGNMRPGVIILRIGPYPVGSIEDYKAAIAKVVEARPPEVAVFCMAGTVKGFFRLQPRWSE